MVQEPLKKPRELPQIPGYRIEGIVGRGATGIVYRARQLSVDRVVALKVLHAELVGSHAATRRMQREARLTAKLAHPSIISAIDMGEIGGQWWYAMELIDGVSIAERIAERPFTEREALRVFAPILDAMQHAFERGVVHRDIKPSNLLIERGGRTLLVDLGLAYSDEDPALTKSGATLGTPHYMSPEQARDPKSADAQSDLWSLGATLYHAVTGRTPFRGESVAEILSNVLYARIPDPREFAPELSSGFVLVLRKCLARDRAARYQTPAELAADFERLRERRAPSVRAQGLDPLERRPLRGVRLYGVVVGSALALGLGSYGGWQWAQASKALPPPDPTQVALERLAAAPDGPAIQLAAALNELEALRAEKRADPERLANLELRLLQRLNEELVVFQDELRSGLEQALGQRQYATARQLAQQNLRAKLAARIGSRVLPQPQSQALDTWQAQLIESVLEAERNARFVYLQCVDRFGSEVLLPSIDVLEREGDWRAARERLERAPAEWLAEAELDVRGLDADTLARAEDALRVRLQARRSALDAAWQRLDEEWVRWSRERAAQLARELETRARVRAAQDFEREASAWQTARGLSSERYPSGLVCRGPEALAAGLAALQGLEQRLAAEDSERLMAELDMQATSLWRARDYEAVAQLFSAQPRALLPEHSAGASLASMRVREAELLRGLLLRASAALQKAKNSKIEILVGTLPLAGRVELDGDPLQASFRFLVEETPVRRLALRERAASNNASVLSTESVLQLAGLSSSSSDERLLRALFLFREAHEEDSSALALVADLLDRGPMPAQEPLVAELGRSLAAMRNRTLDAVQRERRIREGARLALLRRMLAEGSVLESSLRLASELLEEPELWSADELVFLRQTRDQLKLERAIESDPARALGASQSATLADGRLRLVFDLARGQSGAFAIGSWLPDGAGWAAPRSARDDAEFHSRAAPTLALNGLAVAKHDLVVRVQLTQAAEARPEVLLVSANGFHVLFFAQGEDAKARIVVDTLSGERALSRARAGEGVPFAGWKAGAKVELALTLSQARGQAWVEVDKKRVASEDVPVPRASGVPLLVLRSWERVQFSSVTLEAVPQR